MNTQWIAGVGPFQLSVAACSEKGARVSNEDRMGMVHVAGNFLCFALADGAGGQGNGALAARLTVDAVMQGAKDNPMFAPVGLASLISMAEQHVSEVQPSTVSRRHMSATILLLVFDLHSGRALWGHWGDSRLYWFRNGNLKHVTEDHSLAQQLVQAGVYADPGARQGLNRNVLTGAVGAHSQVPPTVRSQAVDLADGDAFLLCSDGFWEGLDVPWIEASLSACADPQTWLQALSEKVNAQSKVNQDNFSALAVWVGRNAPEDPCN